eukprot:TRINITY_DN31956_c0_g1_i1.p1 TRINITY_DN31956_c0_g1~~TRINITY_DN31956_c0_g1_i1.p1  ORF type:complete len:126 (+),score=11.73 TRINITY_DN31956_c0_g1_i1:69-446(+)
MAAASPVLRKQPSKGRLPNGLIVGHRTVDMYCTMRENGASGACPHISGYLGHHPRFWEPSMTRFKTAKRVASTPILWPATTTESFYNDAAFRKHGEFQKRTIHKMTESVPGYSGHRRSCWKGSGM